MEAALVHEKAGMVSIIVPVYNEASHIENSLQAMIARLEDLGMEFEIIVVESGSTDDSGAIIERFSRSEARVRLLHQKKREGLGSAIASGFSEARGDYFFWIDSDLPYDLSYLKAGLDLMFDADIVAGYRVISHRPFKRRIYTAVFNFMVNTLFSLHVRDINFAFKLFKREVFNDIEISSKSSFFAAEILIKCRKKNFKIKQMGVDYRLRRVGHSKLGNWRTVAHILLEMARFTFTGRAGK